MASPPILSPISSRFNDLGPFASATSIYLANAEAIPPYPVTPIIASDEDYTAWIAAKAAWETENSAARIGVETSKAAQIQYESLVTRLMRPNVWYYVSGLGKWGLITHCYISLPVGERKQHALNGYPLYTIHTSLTHP